MKKQILAFIFIVIVACKLSGQVSVKDSSIYTPIVGAGYGYYLSAGDMVKRFGNNSSLQLSVDFKTRYYWMLGVNVSYIFGNKIKDHLFDSIATPSGGIINKNGQFSDIRLYERGFTISGTIGRMVHFKRPNPNSGLVFDVGFGFIQHKIRIETIGNNVPQLTKQYKKGYDRLSNGFLLSENVGYLYLSNNRLVNVYFGLEFMQGFTKSRRSFDYETMQRDTQKRRDYLYGAKIVWILPLYRKPPQEFYYH